MGKKDPTPAEWVMLVSAAVMLVGSLLDFARFLVVKTNVWGRGFFPIASLSVIYAVFLGGRIALVRFAGASFRDRIAGFTWKQIDVAFSVFACLMSLSWIASGIPSKGAGFWTILFGSFGLVAGAIVQQSE